MASLVSVNVGLPKDVAWQARTVHTGIWKRPVEGRRMVRRLNIDGDGQGDLAGHGGEQRAVLVYQTQSYDYWRRLFGRDDLEYGRFGENFTVDGLADDEVCIGDRYRIGEAEFEVTQPRVTCFRVGLRLGVPAMPSLLVAHHRPGFYLRVIQEGHVQAGDEIVRTGTGPHALSVADVDALLYLPKPDPDQLRSALDVPALSPGWQQSFRDLLHTGAEVEARWSGFRRLRLADVVVESADVVSLHLISEDGTPLPEPSPGQYLPVRVTGAGEPAPVRSYSLSSAPGAGAYRISVKREPKGIVSTYLHSGLQAGATLEAAAPRGDFVLTESSRPVLLISAGIGITPVLAMLGDLAARKSPREIWWIHTARDSGHHPFAAEAHRLLQTLPKAHEHTVYTSVVGRMGRATLASLGFPVDAVAYVCGPASFMTDVQAALVDLGIDPGEIHSELFGARPPLNPGIRGLSPVPPHLPAGPPGTGPLVSFARSGLAVHWSGTYLSLLELAEACDVPTRFSCRTGVCHTCTTPIVSGEVTYDPPPLAPPATGDVLICCARAATDLVLDL